MTGSDQSSDLSGSVPRFQAWSGQILNFFRFFGKIGKFWQKSGDFCIWSSQVAWFSFALGHNGGGRSTPLPPGAWPGIPFGGHFWPSILGKMGAQAGVQLASLASLRAQFRAEICEQISRPQRFRPLLCRFRDSRFLCAREIRLVSDFSGTQKF